MSASLTLLARLLHAGVSEEEAAFITERQYPIIIDIAQRWQAVREGDTMSADLTGRTAYCGRSWVGDPERPGHRPQPSEAVVGSFLQYLGPGGANERICAVCGCYEEPHLRVTSIAKGAKVIDHDFVPRPPLPFDDYYCGCRGWD